ncbi:GtrA family protein [Stackebrandtia nassauensis]|uniref:GtrA family protein n=1 Tax=Stackebrandtia nassauensis (strain DSM 44728 / CIP 108903 / NRRL B-16338 / NBRC 102104 / LLR-40K-21) TaxID=446470 RepID=D3Q809_STANL|nr:GtrA family protein [Stackebrandtia nassauensis]ADD40514.1 GtrA family protein [Stackebrandtia nassauensis DSM 44728]
MVAQESAARESAPPRLYRRFAHLFHEVGKFMGVGAVAYSFDLALFNAAVYLWAWEALPAKTFSTCVAATIAFVGNRFWTWRHRPRSRLHREYLWYFLFNTIGLGINLLWVWAYEWANGIWPSVLDNPIALNLVANVIGVGTAAAFRFYSYRTWVFSDTGR